MSLIPGRGTKTPQPVPWGTGAKANHQEGSRWLGLNPGCLDERKPPFRRVGPHFETASCREFSPLCVKCTEHTVAFHPRVEGILKITERKRVKDKDVMGIKTQVSQESAALSASVAPARSPTRGQVRVLPASRRGAEMLPPGASRKLRWGAGNPSCGGGT